MKVINYQDYLNCINYLSEKRFLLFVMMVLNTIETQHQKKYMNIIFQDIYIMIIHNTILIFKKHQGRKKKQKYLKCKYKE